MLMGQKLQLEDMEALTPTLPLPFVRLLKTQRKQLGLTLEEFAEKDVVELTVIRKIEQGKGNAACPRPISCYVC